QESLLAHVAFTVEGRPEPIGVRILTGPAREAILRDRSRGKPPGLIVVLQARQRFPNRARVSLVWGRGVAAASGAEPDQDQVLAVQVRAPFAATVHCERERRDAGCLPITPMTVDLSAPVAWEAARGIVVTGPGGRRFLPEAVADEARAFVQQVVFKGPFPEQAACRVEMPPALRA